MITLIGTSHLDLDGYDRLKKLLDHLQPSVIGIENTQEDYDVFSGLVKKVTDPQVFEQALQNAQRQFPDANPDTIKSWLSSTNYENKAINEYSAINNTSIIYCDDPEELDKLDFDSEVSRPESSFNRQITKFLSLSPEEARADIAQEYSLKEYPVVDCAGLTEFYQERDKFTEQALRAQKGNLVYICGLDHIFGDYTPNLFDRLSDINPKRMKLNKADSIS
ncbi:hypothetical protein HQ545_06165 [Candidatus Woesearchaeota archaeon]|nr:hypothetical protein [Candidatus Woesearchaeota archaeon]